MKKKIFLIIICLLLFTGCDNKKSEMAKSDEMISYTIDGEISKEKPTKESGYFVNKIICDNDSNLVWDNDNWQVELYNIKSDKCNIDFTKDINSEGYRVTVISNVPSNLDSLSKTTIENGTVTIYSKAVVESVTGCNGVIDKNKVIISKITSNQLCNITVEDKSLASILKGAYPPQPGRTNFDKIDNGTPGLYTDEDDQGTTYYFSGDGMTMNNWVSFAGKLWRVIRINGNGSVRLLYAGTGGEDGYIGSSSYNSSSSHSGYVGWKYNLGNTLDEIRGTEKSNAYIIVENWYNGLSSSNRNYIDTETIYCNDGELKIGETFGPTSSFFYASQGRLDTNKTPTLKCSNTNDRFTTFGLITADEISFAGGVYGINSPKAYYYLNTSGGSATGSNWWWTMSPFHSVYTYVLRVRGGSNYPGQLNWGDVPFAGVIRPVISLKKEVIVTSGSGTGNDPYILSYNIV